MEARSAERSYPVEVEASPPAEYERVQVLLRLALLVLTGVLGLSIGWFLVVLYLALPVAAAVLLSRKRAEQFLADDGPWMANTVRWTVAVIAYLGFVADALPSSRNMRPETRIQPDARPTVSSALLHIITGLPSALVFTLLMWLAGLAWLVAAVWVLVRKRCPAVLYGLELATVRWMANLLAYQASLVAAYPPFELDGSWPGRARRAAVK